MENELDLSMLSNVTLVVPEKKLTPNKVGKNPTDNDIRVYANGSVFPSEDFAKKFMLRFAIEEDEVPGNGMDVFSSKDWPMITLQKDILFGAIVPKNDPKVDLFAKVGKIDGKPAKTVLEVANNTFGKTTMLRLLADTYGVDWSKTKYVELSLSLDHKMESPSGEFWIPKVISRGARKGEQEIVIRKQAHVFPLIVKHVEEIPVPEEITTVIPDSFTTFPEPTDKVVADTADTTISPNSGFNFGING